MRDMVSEPIKIMDLQRGSDAELMNCLKSIVQSDDPAIVEQALTSLNEIASENSCNFDHCLKRLFTEEEIKNVDQVPNLFEWFSTKFPNFPWPSLSNDMAKFLSKSAEHFKNQPPCLAEILQLFNRYHKIDCYRTSDHDDLCEAIVKILFYMPQPKPNKDVKKYCKDLEEIKGFLKSLCKNKDRADISNTALNCFKTMCELIFSSMNGPKPTTEPSSALVMVLQIVEDMFWKNHMSTVVDEMTSLVKNDEKISKILIYFCKWLLQPPESNVNYLSSWLCLFISNLEPLHMTNIIENVAAEILPSMSHYLKLEEFCKISNENNVLIPLVRAVRLHSIYHRMTSQIATFFKNSKLQPLSQKPSFLQEIVYIAYDGRKQFMRYDCPQCKSMEDWVREYFPDIPYDKKDIYPSTSYGRLCGSKVGLVNLGNTCYMNSVLQALVMTRQFCNEVLLYKPNNLNEQTVLKNVQNLFALLKFSSRHDLHPDEVLRASRPPYFMPGQQQDSSEFLCHLLDVMYEQEKSIILRNSNSDQSISSPLKVEDKEMTDVEGIQSSQIQEDGSTSMTKWTTEENLSEGEESAQTQNVLSDSHSDSTDSGIQSVGGEDCTSSSSSASSPGSSYLVHRVFGGELQVSYQCLQCENQSHNTDSFRDLQLCFLDSLRVTDNITVQNLINANYLTPETLTGDNKYRCDKCAKLCDAQRIIKVLKAPAHLILTLKHFRYNSETRLRQKLRNKIQYDETIKLPVFDQDPVSYKLYAAVVHSGYSMDYGHYFTYARDKNQWYKFNDSYVSETTLEDFKRLEPPDTPYILFYKKCTGAPEQEDLELMSLSKRLQEYVEDDRRMHGEDRRSIRIAKPSQSRYNNHYNRDRNDDDDDKPPSHCRSGYSVPHNTCLY